MFMNVNIRTEKVYKRRRLEVGNNFKELYRFTEENVVLLTQHVFGREKYERRGGALSNEAKMRTFLRLVGDPGFQVGVGEDIGIHQTTVSKIIIEVMDRILLISAKWIKFPVTEDQVNSAKEKWHAIYSFPATIGVIDCFHVEIKKPSNHGDDYINRKGYASLNIQATCDASEVFTSVDVSWPGSVHDARIWKNSVVFDVMKSGNGLLLGDSGYPLSPFLMTPYRNPLTLEERAYSRVLTKERVIIERCFGQLKQRFPILQSKIRLQTKNIPKLVICCVVLHNIGKSLQDHTFQEWSEYLPVNEDEVIGEGGGGGEEEEERRGEVQYRRMGAARRQEISRIIHENSL